MAFPLGATVQLFNLTDSYEWYPIDMTGKIAGYTTIYNPETGEYNNCYVVTLPHSKQFSDPNNLINVSTLVVSQDCCELA